jgi:hypothetical protein
MRFCRRKLLRRIGVRRQPPIHHARNLPWSVHSGKNGHCVRHRESGHSRPSPTDFCIDGPTGTSPSVATGEGDTEQQKSAIFEREDGATRHVSRSTLGRARTSNGLSTQSVLRGGTLWSRMWREVRYSAAAGWSASSSIARIVDWATAKRIVQAQVPSQQDDQCAQSKLVSEPLAILDQGLGQW